MSANPEPRPVVTGDLDLLISRFLDGDLSGEEERELKSLLDADPAARARYEAMAALVGRLGELPEPETPFALATRVASQVEAESQGLAAALHRYGFYFRPATIGVVVAGLVTVAFVVTLRNPPKPAATVAVAKAPPAAAPADDGRVSVYFTEPGKKDAAPGAEAQAAPAAARPLADAPAKRAADEVKGTARQEPVLVASTEAPREKEESSFAPETDAAPVAASAPAPSAPRAQAAEVAEERVAMQKSAAPEGARLRAAAPAAVGGVRAPAAAAEVVGKAAGTLRIAAGANLDGLSGPFEGTYRLELDGSGRVVEAVRLFGGSGTEPAGIANRLKAVTFAPAEAARAAGSVDVKVRLP